MTTVSIRYLRCCCTELNVNYLKKETNSLVKSSDTSEVVSQEVTFVEG